MTRHAPSVTVVLRAFPVMRNTRAASSRPGQIPSATVYVLGGDQCPGPPPTRIHPGPGNDGPRCTGRPFAVLVGVRAGCWPGLCGERPAQVRALGDRGHLRQGQAVPPSHRRGARGGPGRTRRTTHRAVRASRAGHRAGLPTRTGLPGLRRRVSAPSRPSARSSSATASARCRPPPSSGSRSSPASMATRATSSSSRSSAAASTRRPGWPTSRCATT